LAGEVVDCGLVGTVGGSKSGWDRWVGVAEFGQAGSPEPLVDTGEEERGSHAGAGELVAEGVRDAFDEAVVA